MAGRFHAEPFAAQCRRFRRGDWHEHRGFRRTERVPDAEVIIDPCPHGDFNGAGFLYFANFQAILDRAEWAMNRDTGAIGTTMGRDLFFHGNVNPGDRLTVRRCGSRATGDARTDWFDIHRHSDGARIADAFTTRGLPQRRQYLK